MIQVDDSHAPPILSDPQVAALTTIALINAILIASFIFGGLQWHLIWPLRTLATLIELVLLRWSVLSFRRRWRC